MKLRFMSLVVVTALLVSCGTTRYNSTSHAAYNVPVVIGNHFDAQYPTATNVVWVNYNADMVTPIDWEMTGWTVLEPSDYLATFDMGNEKLYAWYDGSGTWIGSTYAIRDYNSLPVSVNTLLRDSYRDYTIESVQKEMWKDRTAYEIKLRNGDTKTKLLIDTNGNIIKQKDK